MAVLMSLLLFACTDLNEELLGEFTESYSEANPAAAFIDADTSGGSAGSGSGGSAGSGGGGSDLLGGPYSKLRDGSAGHFGHFSSQTLPSDEAWIATKGGDWYDGGILIDLHKHNFLANNGIIGNTWNQAYSGINAVNIALFGADSEDDGTKQLRTLRAYFYYRLLDLYGRVKLITTVKKEGDNFVSIDAPQSSRSEVFDFVEAELLDVLGLTRAQVLAGAALTAFGPSNNAYRANQYGALGLLAKLYLNAEVYTGTALWAEAAAAANYIIENGSYKLATASYSTGVGDAGTAFSVTNLGRLNPSHVDREDGNIYTYDNLEGYAAIFAANNGGNPEFVWSIEYDEVDAHGMNFAKMTLHYGSQFTWNFEAQPWNGYATLQDFYNDYDPGDRRQESNHITGVQRTFNGGIVRDYAKEPKDTDSALDYTPENTGGIFPNGLRQAGARLGKFSFKQFGRPNQDNDYPIIRLGEMYLIRAEGKARAAGDWSLALPDVNIIRGRAGAAALSSIDAGEFLAERGREMFQESTRRSDQIRFGKYYAGADSGRRNDATVSPAYKNVMPIPLDAINAANGSLSQNEGY